MIITYNNEMKMYVVRYHGEIYGWASTIAGAIDVCLKQLKNEGLVDIN